MLNWLTHYIEKNDEKFTGRNRFRNLIGKGGMSVVYDMDDHAVKITPFCDNTSSRDMSSLSYMTGEIKLEYIGNKEYVVKEAGKGETITKKFAESFVRMHKYSLSEYKILNDLKDITEVVDAINLRYMSIKGIVCSIIEMDKIEGDNMLDLMKIKSGISLKEGALASLTLCNVVEELGKRGYVNRDLKTQNIMKLNNKDEYRLVDFGLSMPEKGFKELDQIDANEQALLNETDYKEFFLQIGSPQYWSPEHPYGEMVTHKSDIFSAGVTTYELLTGKLLFKPKTMLNYSHSFFNDISERLTTEKLPMELKNAFLKTFECAMSRRELGPLKEQLRILAAEDANYKPSWLPIFNANRITLV